MQVSGREVFEFRPELVDDDDAEADDTGYANDESEEEEEEVNGKLRALFILLVILNVKLPHTVTAFGLFVVQCIVCVRIYVNNGPLTSSCLNAAKKGNKHVSVVMGTFSTSEYLCCVFIIIFIVLA